MGLSSACSAARLCHAEEASQPGLCLKKSQEWIFFFFEKTRKRPKILRSHSFSQPPGFLSSCSFPSRLGQPPRPTVATAPTCFCHPKPASHTKPNLPGPVPTLPEPFLVSVIVHIHGIPALGIPLDSCSPWGWGAASSLPTRLLGSFLLLPPSPCSCPLLRWTLLQLCLPTRLG